MKKLLFLSALLFSIISFAQVPQGISYQAIATNGSGNPVVSSNVGIRLSILDNSASGTLVYSETHTKTTNAQGLFNLVIGQGTASAGTFAGINWGTNPKFLKVEMDIAGGSNYVLVGTTQLLSVPYALASDSLITSPGEGITLISPNGTPYQITVNDAGQLSLPTSAITGSNPDVLYAYGSFNGFDPNSALLMSSAMGSGSISKFGLKYFTSGTQIKFLAANSSASPVYGVNGLGDLVINAPVYTVASTGFYLIQITYNSFDPSALPYFNIYQDIPAVQFNGNNINPTYNVLTNTFSFVVNGVTISNNSFNFILNEPGLVSYNFGDNLSDGSIDAGGAYINFPNATATPKNFRIDLIINFNGSGTYTMMQIP